jgi:hypothetical protein
MTLSFGAFDLPPATNRPWPALTKAAKNAEGMELSRRLARRSG